MIASPEKSSKMQSLADVSVTTAPTTLGALPAGPNGILLTAHPNNLSVIRVSGADCNATHGQPLGAGASVVLNIADAASLRVCTESGTATLCVSQV